MVDFQLPLPFSLTDTGVSVMSHERENAHTLQISAGAFKTLASPG